jgi:hypothetical protein
VGYLTVGSGADTLSLDMRAFHHVCDPQDDYPSFQGISPNPKKMGTNQVKEYWGLVALKMPS